MGRKQAIITGSLPGSPGSLVELIKPISNNGGNIFSILHYHDKKINNMIPVTVMFEVNQKLLEVSIKKIEKELNEKNIKIESITVGTENRHITVILTGHVFDTDVLDTIDRLAIKKIKVSELHARFTENDDISTVKLNLEFPESMTKSDLLKEIDDICQEKNLFLIRS